MGAVTRDTTLYTNKVTNKYLQDQRDHDGRSVRVPFEVTIQSASSAADVYRLMVLPPLVEVTGLYAITDGLGASAGSSVDVIIGDADNDDRYMAATDMDVAEASGKLAFAGTRYRTTAETIVLLKHDAAAVVGKIVKGWIEYVPVG